MAKRKASVAPRRPKKQVITNVQSLDTSSRFFFEEGYVVIEDTGIRFSIETLVKQSRELTQTFRDEFTSDKAVTYGGFGGYGFSAFGEECRELDKQIFDVMQPVLHEYFALCFPDQAFQVLQVLDRYRIQLGFMRPTVEAKHVDAPSAGFSKTVAYVAGFINLGATDLYFEVCPRSQHDYFEVARGHHKIPKEDDGKYETIRVRIPPGSIYLQHPAIVHAVMKQEAGAILFRKHFAFLGGPNLDQNPAVLAKRGRVHEILRSQGNIQLPSDQDSVIYPKQYQVALKYTHLPAVMAWLEKNVVGGHSSIDHKRRIVASLESLGLCHRPYSPEELAIFDFKTGDSASTRA